MSAVLQCSESLQCISAVHCSTVHKCNIHRSSVCLCRNFSSLQWLEGVGLEEQGLGAELVGCCSALAQCTSAVHECNIRSLEEHRGWEPDWWVTSLSLLVECSV